MGLKIKVQKQKGQDQVDIEYWEIVEFYAKPVEKYFVCELRGFTSKQAYADYLDTGVTKQDEELRYKFSMSGPDYPDTSQANWVETSVEEFIKSQPNKYGVDWTKATKEAKVAKDNGKSK